MRKTTVTLVALLGALLVSGQANAAPPKGGRVAGWVRTEFHNLSHKNGNTRVLHRPGEAYQGTLRAPAGSPLGAGAQKVTVRLSRGANAAEPKKDFLGLAVRIPHAGGNEDLLMVSSGTGTVGRRIPSRAGSFAEKSYSSLLPVRVDGQKYVVRAYPTGPAQPPQTGTDFNQLHTAVAGGSASFRLELAGVHGGPNRPLGDVTLERPLSGAESNGLKFNPWGNPTVRPAGLLNTMRRWAYEGSQSTR